GYIALAALIMGKWRPVPTAASCLLFAFADALEGRLQGTLPGVPVHLVAVLPYLLTVLVLAGFIGRARAPKAIGVPYMRTRCRQRRSSSPPPRRRARAPTRPIRASPWAPRSAPRTAASMPGPTSRTPAIPWANAPRPRPSAPWSPPARGAS